MFKLFKNKKDRLEKEYQALLKKALDAQRNGDMALFAKLSTEADFVLKKIEEAESK